MRPSCSGLVSRYKAIRLVDHERTLMYWQIGQRIFEEEQQGKDRADYGDYLTKFIADQLEPEYGSGFSKRQIELFHQFYCAHSQLRIQCIRNWVGANIKS
jgi:hypothetical protein